MKRFHYRAVDVAGKSSQGFVDAPNLQAALSIVTAKGLRAFDVTLATDGAQLSAKLLMSFSLNGPSLHWRAKLYQKLAILLGAGVSIDRSLHILAQQSGKAWEQQIYTKISATVASGGTLSQAVSEHLLSAHAGETGLIRAAENTGRLSATFAELAHGLERQAELRSRVSSALVYPAFLMLLAPITLIVIATVLIPNIAPLFESTGTQMPFILRFMMSVSKSWSENRIGWLIGLFAFIAGLTYLIRSVKFRDQILTTFFGLPFFANFHRAALAARLCKSLADLLKAGMPLQLALLSVAETLPHRPDQQKLIAVRDQVSSGAKFSLAIDKSELLDRSAVQMISVGEETNQLEPILHHIAKTSETELWTSIDRIMVLLVPILTIAMGLIIGGIMMSVMNAILALNQLAAQ